MSFDTAEPASMELRAGELFGNTVCMPLIGCTLLQLGPDARRAHFFAGLFSSLAGTAASTIGAADASAVMRSVADALDVVADETRRIRS